jgi:DNA-binding protein YbaB
MNGATTADTSGCVTITLDHTGQVDEIHLPSRWRDQLDSAQLSDALVKAWLDAAERGQVEPPNSWTNFQVKLSEPGEDDALQGVAEKCRQVLIEAAKRMDRDRAISSVDHTGADARRHVVVTLGWDAAPRSITLDDKWLASVSTDRLVDTIREAFEAAHTSLAIARAPAEGAEPFPAGTPTGRIE